MYGSLSYGNMKCVDVKTYGDLVLRLEAAERHVLDLRSVRVHPDHMSAWNSEMLKAMEHRARYRDIKHRHLVAIGTAQTLWNGCNCEMKLRHVPIVKALPS